MSLALKVRYSSLSTFLEECLFDRSPGEILVKPNHPLSVGDRVLLKVCFTSIPEELTIEGIVEENTATAWRVRFAGMALDQLRRLSRLLSETKDRRPSKAKVLILQGNPHAVSSRVQVREIVDWTELHGWCRRRSAWSIRWTRGALRSMAGHRGRRSWTSTICRASRSLRS